MNPDELFSSSSRRLFLKRSAYSAAATTFAFSATSILTSCQTRGGGTIYFPGGTLEFYWSSGPNPSSLGPLTINDSSGGPTATNTSDQPVTVTGSDGESITIPPGQTVQIQQ